MSKKKKRHLSRRLRKLRKIGKKPLEFIQTDNPSSDKEKYRPILSEQPPIDKALIKPKLAPEKADYPIFNEEKSKEILGNIKTVMTVSVACLVILGILYYFESQNDWVDLVNTKINEFMAGWSWSF